MVKVFIPLALPHPSPGWQWLCSSPEPPSCCRAALSAAVTLSGCGECMSVVSFLLLLIPRCCIFLAGSFKLAYFL